MATPLAISLVPAIASPWVANASVTQGDIRSQAGVLYTAPLSFTAGASFSSTNWTVGAPAGVVFEQNGSGQVIAIWKGNGLGNAATKILDVLTAGAFTAQGAWSNTTAYGVSAIVNRNGSGYISLVGNTGIDPATDPGTTWMLLASKGDVGATGAAGSATADGAVLSRNLSDLARSASVGWMIGSGFAQNFRRDDAASTATTAARTILSSGGLVLPGGRAVTALRVVPTTAIGTPLHQFVAFYNARTLALLASGTDVTTQAMTVNTDVTFPISYTPASGIEVLAIYYCEATTTPVFAAKASNNVIALTPRFGGLHDVLAAGSGPAALPATLGAATASRGPFWLQVE